jgi:hypothetical protein
MWTQTLDVPIGVSGEKAPSFLGSQIIIADRIALAVESRVSTVQSGSREY